MEEGTASTPVDQSAADANGKGVEQAQSNDTQVTSDQTEKTQASDAQDKVQSDIETPGTNANGTGVEPSQHGESSSTAAATDNRPVDDANATSVQQPENEDWKLPKRSFSITSSGTQENRIFTKRRFTVAGRGQVNIPKPARRTAPPALASASAPKAPSPTPDGTRIVEQGENFTRRRPVSAANISRINRIIRPEPEEEYWADVQTPEDLRGEGPFYIQRSESDLTMERPRKTQKMRWTTENDMMLLLFGLGRDIAGSEYKLIADWFAEKPTPKAIQERLTKLRGKTRQVLRESGIYDSEEVPSRGSLNSARGRSAKKDESRPSQQRPSKKPRTSGASVNTPSPLRATAHSSDYDVRSAHVPGIPTQSTAEQLSPLDLRVLEMQQAQDAELAQNMQRVEQEQQGLRQWQPQTYGHSNVGPPILGAQSFTQDPFTSQQHASYMLQQQHRQMQRQQSQQPLGQYDADAPIRGVTSLAPGHVAQQQHTTRLTPGFPSSPPSVGATPTRQGTMVNPYTGAPVPSNFPSSPLNFTAQSPAMSYVPAQPRRSSQQGAPHMFANTSPSPGVAYPGMASSHQFQQQTPHFTAQQQQYPPYFGMAPVQPAGGETGTQSGIQSGNSNEGMSQEASVVGDGADAKDTEGQGAEGEVE